MSIAGKGAGDDIHFKRCLQFIFNKHPKVWLLENVEGLVEFLGAAHMSWGQVSEAS